MGCGIASCSRLFCVLVLVLQYGYKGSAREITKEHWNNVDKEVYHLHQPTDDIHDQNVMHVHDHHPSSHMDHMDPSLNVFFTVNDLFLGKNMPIYFSTKDPSTTPHLLPREEVDSIPFSSSELPYLLKFFSFSENSPQAKAMEYTLKQCELENISGERKFCATSLESMLDSIRTILGLDTRFKVLTTTVHFSKPTTLLQNYSILEVPVEIKTPKMVACHTMPYPYAVFYCHSRESGNKLFKVALGGENGDKVEAVAVCHMDTSQWDSDHVAFRVLRTRPGVSPVCHFFPADNLVWVSSPSVF